MIKIEIKDSVKIIENRNKIYYFVSGIEIFNFYFNFIEFFLSLYPVLVIHIFVLNNIVYYILYYWPINYTIYIIDNRILATC